MIGYQVSGSFHLGHYMILKDLMKLKDVKVKVLLSDFHARLNNKSNVDQNLKKSIEFFKLFYPQAQIVCYSSLLPKALELIGQLSLKVSTRDLYRALPTELKIREPSVTFNSSYYLYSLLQCVDPYLMDVDTVYAGVDQRNIYMMGNDSYDKLNWPKLNYRFYPLLLTNKKEKLSSSGFNIPLDQSIIPEVILALNGQKSRMDYVNWPDYQTKIETLTQLKKDMLKLKGFRF